MHLSPTSPIGVIHDWLVHFHQNANAESYIDQVPHEQVILQHCSKASIGQIAHQDPHDAR